jgi:hypothetical protein
MDLATAQTHLNAWLAADIAVASGQSYQIGEVALSRVDSRQIRTQISYWQGIVAGYTSAAAGGTSRAALATFGCVE